MLKVLMHCAIGWLHQVPAGDEGPPREPQAALRDLGLAGRDDATTTFVESRIAATAPAPHGGGTMIKFARGVCCNFVCAMILPQVHLRKPCYDFSFL
jgi:hypothetical protein